MRTAIMIRRSLLSGLMLVALACSLSNGSISNPTCASPAEAEQPIATSRPFRMGFTTWPPEATIEGLEKMYQFIADHSDLTAVQLDGGVPWPEALADGDYPRGMMDDWQREMENLTPGHAVFVSITPLDLTHSGLALYRGNQTNQALPPEWEDLPLHHPNVQEAYRRYAHRVVEFFQPEYLAIGIEVNVAMVASAGVWNAYLDLHRLVYTSLKQAHPDLPVFASVTLSHLSGLDGAIAVDQQRGIAALMEYSDLLGISAYPYGWAYEQGKLDPIPEEYFTPALPFGKPIAITESGAPSRNFSAFGRKYEFTEKYQASYIRLLLREAVSHQFAFVINWTSLDFEPLLQTFPEDSRELASFWVYTGLQGNDECPKTALTEWDAYLRLPITPIDGKSNEDLTVGLQ